MSYLKKHQDHQPRKNPTNLSSPARSVQKSNKKSKKIEATSSSELEDDFLEVSVACRRHSPGNSFLSIITGQV